MDLYDHIVNVYEVKYCKLKKARSTALGQLTISNLQAYLKCLKEQQPIAPKRVFEIIGFKVLKNPFSFPKYVTVESVVNGCVASRMCPHSFHIAVGVL